MQRFLLIWSRAVRLRCPSCGQGKLFRGWFSMHAKCQECGLTFEREPGFYLGAIYFNYGLTALLITILYPVSTLVGGWDRQFALGICVTIAVLFPLAYFRHARSLWLGFDHFVDPRVQDKS